MRTTVCATIAAALVAGCGAPKEKQPEAAPPVIMATTPDSAAKAVADSIAADSAKRAGSKATRKAGEKPLRDSAFGPKFKVDSTGKVTPVKKP